MPFCPFLVLSPDDECMCFDVLRLESIRVVEEITRRFCRGHFASCPHYQFHLSSSRAAKEARAAAPAEREDEPAPVG